MFSLLTDNVFFKLLSHADWLSKSIVCILIGLSIACWWIFFHKLYTLNIAISHARYARNRLYAIHTFDELAHLARTLHDDAVGMLIAKTVGFIGAAAPSGMSSHTKATDIIDRPTVSVAREKPDSTMIKTIIDQTFADIMQHQDAFVPVVRLSAETGTLIGLFGTVWGLIHAFNRISERQTADIPTVAPGISEALIVTLTGLFVAIPAMIHYYVIMKKIRILEGELSAVADRLERIINEAPDTPGCI